MKSTEFQDLNGQEITVQRSSLATEEAFRVYLKGDEKYSFYDKASGHNIHPCMHINRHQAQILISSLQDFLDAEQ